MPHGFLFMASIRESFVIFSVKSGYFYRHCGQGQHYWRCVHSMFTHLDRDLGLGYYDAISECAAREDLRDMPHDHPPPPFELVSLFVFRWQCINHAMDSYLRIAPNQALKEIYSSWQYKMPITRSKALRWLESTLNQFVGFVKTEEHPFLWQWLRTCNRYSMKETVLFYVSTKLWPCQTKRMEKSRSKFVVFGKLNVVSNAKLFIFNS